MMTPTELWSALTNAVKANKLFAYLLGIPASAAAIALAATYLKGHLNSVGGVTITIVAAALLMMLFIIITAVAKLPADRARPQLTFMLWSLSILVLLVAVLSITSLFFNWPRSFTDEQFKQPVTADYRVDSVTVCYDLRDITSSDQVRRKTQHSHRVEYVTKLRDTKEPFRIRAGTQGNPLKFSSTTHPAPVLQVQDETDPHFPQTTAHTYSLLIAADKFSINVPTRVEIDTTFDGGFNNEKEEWAGYSPGEPTTVMTMLVLLPPDRRCVNPTAKEKQTGAKGSLYEGESKPVVLDGGQYIAWTVPNPKIGVGHYLELPWQIP